MPTTLRLLVIVVIALAAACSTNGADEADTGGPQTVTGDGPGSAGMCVETYSPETLRNRELAFDGTVRTVEEADGAQQVTFDVHRWFKGGEGGEATLVAYGFGGITSVGGGERKVGDRLLVAGDDDFVWECGFTQGYDAVVAAQWEAALGG